MDAKLNAVMDLHPGQIALDFTWIASGPRPDLRLVRRQLAYPLNPEDGQLVLAWSDWFSPTGESWSKLTNIQYLLPNALREGGMLQGEVSYAFANPGDLVPTQIVVRIYDASTGTMAETHLENITRLKESRTAISPWAQVHTIEIFSSPGAGPEESAGKLIVSTGNSDFNKPDQFAWLPSTGPAVSVPFDQVYHQETILQVLAKDGQTLRIQSVPSTDIYPGISAVLDESFDPDTGEYRRRVLIVDQNLLPGTFYYYSLFSPDTTNPGQWHVDPSQQACALAGQGFHLGNRLYQLLPEVLRRYDEPEPADRGAGLLRAYLQMIGAGLDQTRSLAEGLRTRHDLAIARADLLPHLAQWIGWDLDKTLDAQTQRTDILHAPRIFETIGTIPNLRSLVNRVTGWECEVKEFVNNVFLTNSPETVLPWELWGQSLDMSLQWSASGAVTTGEGFDGHPRGMAVLGDQDWVFFHADRGNRREIWMKRLAAASTSLKRAAEGLPDDKPDAAYRDENPFVFNDLDKNLAWLFWDSNRDGQWEIYARPYNSVLNGISLNGKTLQRLTNHPADDRFPTAVLQSSGKYWVFWQSNRRGPTDIWGMQGDSNTWEPPQRVTTATFRDETPTAIVDGDDVVWLFWCADLGDRRNLYWQSFKSTWEAPQPLTDGPFRDESPTAVYWNNQIWVFWHSNRGGRWQVWATFHDGGNWEAPFALVTSPADEKEPGALVDSFGNLRLLWRSQRRLIRHRSRTVDFEDPQMLQAINTLSDHMHYTYDIGKENNNWYARDTIGLYLKPDITDSLEIAQQMERVQAFTESFRPLPVRFIWMTL